MTRKEKVCLFYENKVTRALLLGQTLTSKVATPPMPNDAGVVFGVINFATPPTQNPRGVGKVLFQGENSRFLVPEKNYESLTAFESQKL